MIEVKPLSPEYAPGAVNALTVSFAAYPLLERAFAGAMLPVEAMSRRMFDWAIAYRLALDIPALVAVDGGQVVGAATLRVPGGPELPPEFRAHWAELERDMDPEGVRLFDQYERLQDSVLPSPPPTYLVAIGVSPAHQGRGIGRALIERARQLSGPAGLMLDTHDPANVPKYIALGFDLVHVGDLGGLPNWYFRRG